MKNFLFVTAGILVLPGVFICMAIYGALYILQLLFRTINLQIEKGMIWVDKNITQNIR